MQTFTGIVKGNTVLLGDDILPYDGRSVVVTVIDDEKPRRRNLSKFKIPSPRGNRADEYVREMRDNDRF